jgi:predicted extracellular nuclease
LQKIDGEWNAPAENTFGGCGSGGGSGGNEPRSVKIHEVQGVGPEVAITDLVEVEAIVTADFQNANQLSGFFIQEEDSDADANPLSSEGIFIYCDSCPVEVSQGDLVRVQGLPQDFFDMSQIRATFETDITIVSSGNTLPSPATLSLPVSVSSTDIESAQDEIDGFYEAVEGMLVEFSGELSAAEYFQLGRFGQVVMAANGRPRQFTDTQIPSAAGYIEHQINLAARTIILDDDNSSQNFALNNDVAVFHPQPGLSVDNYFRGGDTIENMTGVLHYAFSEWRVRPAAGFDYRFEASNPRPEAPADVGGTLKVASFNVLNYFTTLDEAGNQCGPEASFGCRGADSAEELLRQTQKIVTAICALDADIIGLMELENPVLGAEVTPIEALVDAINGECSEYAAVATGSVGTDAITVGFIYRPDFVSLVGDTAVLDDLSFTDPNNTGVPKNRAVIAQGFKDLEKEVSFTVAVNHLKSKGSSCGAGDDDTTTGQGNCNLTRTLAAQAQAEWLATNPTNIDSDLVLVIGDLNAYRNEDPIVAFENAGYTDVIDQFNGESAYGFLFDGQLGYLDHALANEALLPYITGASDWHINADEINLLDYNDTVRDDSEASFEAKPSATELFAPDAYRSSDHDPLVIGLDLPRTINAHDLIAFYFESLRDGSIIGRGNGRFWVWLNSRFFVGNLYRVAYFSDRGNDEQACRSLNRAILLADGERRPRDLIRGEGVSELNEMMHALSEVYKCQ